MIGQNKNYFENISDWLAAWLNLCEVKNNSVTKNRRGFPQFKTKIYVIKKIFFPLRP